jgi:hypothetical protein
MQSAYIGGLRLEEERSILAIPANPEDDARHPIEATADSR